MSSQDRRRRHTPVHDRQQSSARWSRWTAGGLALAVVVIVGLVAGAAVLKSDEAPLPATSVPDTAQASPLAPEDHTLGSADAPVTVLEYGDFQCPFCKQFRSGPLKEIEREFVETGQVAVIYRHFIVLGPESAFAAEAAECAGEQDSFFPYHDTLFENQGLQNTGYLTTEKLVAFAEGLGLDTSSFASCLESGRHRDTVIRSTLQGLETGVVRTPTVFVNGRLIRDVSDTGQLRATILDELELADK